MLAGVETYCNLAHFVAALSRTTLVGGLTVACAAIVVGIPVCASKGKLHVPGYVGLALVAFIVGLIFGRIAGSRAITGTPVGVVLSVAFFLLVATALGSILGVLFYRPAPEQ
jgi:MFS superfamily sulfate permease-like transporter